MRFGYRHKNRRLKGTAMDTSEGMVFLVASCFMLVMAGCSTDTGVEPKAELLKRGEELFARNCVGCHPNGENRLYPQKSLHRIDLKANGINTPADIVAVMRHPGKGMKPFDRVAIPDSDARAIAEYIIATF
jgi:cytochrome c6